MVQWINRQLVGEVCLLNVGNAAGRCFSILLER